MGCRIPERYTLVIARTGRPPLTISLRPAMIWGTAAVLAAVALGWGLSIRASEPPVQVAPVLQEKPKPVADPLDSKAKTLLRRLDAVERKLDRIRKQAGMAGFVRGSLAASIGARRTLEMAEQRLGRLEANLDERALRLGLAKAEARPRGMPLRGEVRMTSRFGLRRDPVASGSEFHNGLDFDGELGTPIYATAPGIAETAGWKNGYGRCVVLAHGWGYQTLYGHMSRVAVTEGARVKRGQLIGYVGNTGRSTGTHLHYTVYLQGEAVDPRPYLEAR
jgi:murein DD-endopeptidase MepM/ murein hydrolase activator NlpD